MDYPYRPRETATDTFQALTHSIQRLAQALALKTRTQDVRREAEKRRDDEWER